MGDGQANTQGPDDRHDPQDGCGCGGGDGCSEGLRAFYERAAEAFVSRRHVMLGMGAAALSGWALGRREARAQETQEPDRLRFAPANELVVQPVLTYDLPVHKPLHSWRQWGGLMTGADVDQEVARIEKELRECIATHKLAVKMLPVARVHDVATAENTRKSDCDVMLIYASGSWQPVLEALIDPDRPNLFFLRHESGPISLWYEILHPHFLRKASDEFKQPGVDVQDVIVDSTDELVWRLRALTGLRRTLGQRIVAIGGAGGWGSAGELAPRIAREKWQLDIRDVSYEDLGRRIASARNDPRTVRAAEAETDAYLAGAGVALRTERAYVENGFLLTRVFRDLMDEHETRAITVHYCMGTIMPVSQTTACLTLSVLNDEGYLAFCESDFVVIPSGILMEGILGTPVFLNNPTWPHRGVITLAHCTAPRRMDGRKDEPVGIHTHFESDYGAAPKVELPIGQRVTMVAPDFGCQSWVGCTGRVIGNPFHPICRSQIDVAIDGDWQRLITEMRGFHWMLGYGDCRREIGYAIKHLGIGWQDVSA